MYAGVIALCPNHTWFHVDDVVIPSYESLGTLHMSSILKKAMHLLCYIICLWLYELNESFEIRFRMICIKQTDKMATIFCCYPFA